MNGESVEAALVAAEVVIHDFTRRERKANETGDTAKSLVEMEIGWLRELRDAVRVARHSDDRPEGSCCQCMRVSRIAPVLTERDSYSAQKCENWCLDCIREMEATRRAEGMR